MAVTKPRNRLVNFRVSEDEYQTLQTLTENSGSRSMSDLARNRTLGSDKTLQPVDNAGLIVAKINRLENQMTGLATMLAELLGRSPTPSPSINQEEQLANGGVHH